MKMNEKERNEVLATIREALNHIISIYRSVNLWKISTDFQSNNDYMYHITDELKNLITKRCGVSRREQICSIILNHMNSYLVPDWDHNVLYFFQEEYEELVDKIDLDKIRSNVISCVSRSNPYLNRTSDHYGDGALKDLLENEDVCPFGIPKGIFEWRAETHDALGVNLGELNCKCHRLILVDRGSIKINDLSEKLNIARLFGNDDVLCIDLIELMLANEFYQNKDGIIVRRISSLDSHNPGWVMMIDPSKNNEHLINILFDLNIISDDYFKMLNNFVKKKLWTMEEIERELKDEIDRVEEEYADN